MAILSIDDAIVSLKNQFVRAPSGLLAGQHSAETIVVRHTANLPANRFWNLTL